jgi:hypothetical protein
VLLNVPVESRPFMFQKTVSDVKVSCLPLIQLQAVFDATQQTLQAALILSLSQLPTKGRSIM